jgi:hypothetical protein
MFFNFYFVCLTQKLNFSQVLMISTRRWTTDVGTTLSLNDMMSEIVFFLLKYLKISRSEKISLLIFFSEFMILTPP